MNDLPAFQMELRPALPVVYGCADYRELRAQLTYIDRFLIESGLENQLVAQALKDWAKEVGDPGYTWAKRKAFEALRANKREHLHRALRCDMVSQLMGESFRGLCVRLADSPLLQWFVQVGKLDGARPPSKSTLERYEKEFKAPAIERAIRELVRSVCTPEGAHNLLGLDKPLKVDEVFMDTTCVKANIHFPVDWVLLRDAIRTLIGAILNIRRHGLKHRIPDPASLMTICNRLCIRITHSRRQKGGRRHRKAAFRELKKLAATVGWHGQMYMNLLKKHYAETDLSEADAKVEFGSGLFLAEQKDGLIVDWELMKNQPPADSKLFGRHVDILQKNYGDIEAIATDRGFHSLANDERLERDEIYHAICPKDPRKMEERAQDPRFLELQQRRGQTEGRIGIFKNAFLGGTMLSKGFSHRRITVAWCVLTHNLWVLARLAAAEAKRKAA